MESFRGASPAVWPLNKRGARVIRLTDIEGNEGRTKTSENTTLHIYDGNEIKLGQH